MELTPKQRRLIDKRRIMRATSERVIKDSSIAPKKGRGLIDRLMAWFL